jgi:hypothetical protein
MEPIRPAVDAFVLDPLEERVLTSRNFVAAQSAAGNDPRRSASRHSTRLLAVVRPFWRYRCATSVRFHTFLRFSKSHLYTPNLILGCALVEEIPLMRFMCVQHPVAIVGIVLVPSFLSGCAGGGMTPGGAIPSSQTAVRGVRHATVGLGPVVRTAKGGGVFGWAINEIGADGVLAEALNPRGSEVVSYIETFDQTTGKITKIVAKQRSSKAMTSSSPPASSPTTSASLTTSGNPIQEALESTSAI